MSSDDCQGDGPFDNFSEGKVVKRTVPLAISETVAKRTVPLTTFGNADILAKPFII